ncbi:MAG: hypothetical protein FJZ43_00140 [Candidatus Staskawiczbacteria bacterium]|nr:hypothetical protein [Candidatus Staskawiczbacteria bacterium]
MYYLIMVKPSEIFDGAECVSLEFEISRNNLEAIKQSEKIASEVKFKMPNGQTCKGAPVALREWGGNDPQPTIIKQW